MFTIEKNILKSSGFSSRRLCDFNVSRCNTSENTTNFKGKFKIFLIKETFYLEALNEENKFLGYVKFNEIKETPCDTIIDGEFTELDENTKLIN